MRFSEEELERYARHLLMPEIGGPGQQMLKAARVLVIGAGGLGAPAIQYLGAAGVGTLGIADFDTVDLSNLQRQIIHSTDTLQKPKVKSAEHFIKALNPNVTLKLYEQKLKAETLDTLLPSYDIVLDGTDTYATRRMVAQVCEQNKKPLVSGAVSRFDGNISVFVPYLEKTPGTFYPRYEDVFPSPDPQKPLPTCAQAGILGPVCGVIGSLMAIEAIKLISKTGTPLYGRLLLYDALGVRFEIVECA